MNELDGLILIPIVEPKSDKLVQVRIQFQNAPGMELVFTAAAVAELRDGLTALLNVKDWDRYQQQQLQLKQ